MVRRIRIGTLLLGASLGATASAQDPLNDSYGFYTEKPGYAAGETITIHGNWPKDSDVEYRLYQVTGASDTYAPASLPATWGGSVDPAERNWRYVDSSDVITYTQWDDGGSGADYPIPLRLGSLVEFPLDLAGEGSFSIEGWIYPTYVPSDPLTDEDIVLFGQLQDGSVTNGTLTVSFGGSYGLGISSDGHVVGYLATDAPGEALVVSDDVLDPNTWYHLALTYNGTRLKLWVKGVKQMETAPISGDVEASSAPLRLGGKAEAPGITTGCYDGKVDDWNVWDIALPKSYIEFVAGIGGGPVPVNPSALRLRARFEDGYGINVADTSGNGHHGKLLNHGTPGVGGHIDASQGLRLNYDQLVDADWPHPIVSGTPTAVTIPVPNTEPSGLYVIEAIVDGASPADVELPLNYQCVVITPAAGSAAAQVAVIVPVNTWLAYNGWPGHSNGAYGAVGYPTRGTGISAVVGNNSAYKKMGDGDSTAHYHGWRRPNPSASPYVHGDTNNTPDPIDFFGVRCSAAVHFAQWIDAFLPTLQPWEGETSPAPTYHFFTDWDLTSGNSLLTQGLDTADPGNGTSRYRTWVTIAHHEYWSREMIDHVDAHLGADQSTATNNLLNIAGNLMMWRGDVAASKAVMETRKWPQRLGTSGVWNTSTQSLEHPQDVETLIGGGERSGHWRFLQQLEAANAASDPRKDFAFGTLPSTNAVICNESICQYGPLFVTNVNSYLWDDGTGSPVVSFGQTFGVTDMISAGSRAYIGGHELDRAIPDPNNSMILWAGPHVKPGTTIQLVARLTGAGSYPTIDRDPLLTWLPGTVNLQIYQLYGTDVDQLEQILDDMNNWWNSTWSSNQSATWVRNATVTEYETTAGGRVVSIPTTSAVWSLGSSIDPGAANPVHDPLTLLTLNAFRRMIWGTWGSW